MVRKYCCPLSIFIYYYFIKLKTSKHQCMSTLRRLHNCLLYQIHKDAYRFVITLISGFLHLLLHRCPICFQSQWTLISPYIWNSDKFRGQIVPQKSSPIAKKNEKKNNAANSWAIAQLENTVSLLLGLQNISLPKTSNFYRNEDTCYTLGFWYAYFKKN